MLSIITGAAALLVSIFLIFTFIVLFPFSLIILAALAIVWLIVSYFAIGIYKLVTENR